MDEHVAAVVGNREKIFSAVSAIKRLHDRYSTWRGRYDVTAFDFEIVVRLEAERIEINRQARLLTQELREAMQSYNRALAELERITAAR